MKVESEGDEDGVRGWFDLGILQLIALCEEMEPEFVGMAKNKVFFETLD